MKAGNLDQAVEHYRTAAQADPDNANYKIALERALLAASRAHFDRAREFEAQDQLEAARGEYRLASEYDPTNRQAAPRSPRSTRSSGSASRPPGRGRPSSSCASGRARPPPRRC